MTACVNKRRALAAALAGVLALGGAAVALPAVALAEGASLEAVNPTASAYQGSITAFEDGLESGHVFTYNGKAQGLVPTEAKGFGESVTIKSTGAAYWKVVKKTDANAIKAALTMDGKEIYVDSTSYSTTAPTAIGNYVVFAYVEASDGSSSVVSDGASFSIVANSLSGAAIYEDSDLTDQEFVFTGSAATVVVGLGDTDITSSVDVQYRQNGKTLSGAPTAAGTYDVVLTGKTGSAFAGQKVTLSLVIEPYDLADASVTVKAVAVASAGTNQLESLVAANTTIDGKAYGSWALKGYTTLATATKIDTGVGTLTISPDEAALAAKDSNGISLSGSVVNSATATYDVVDYIASVTAKYNGKAFATYTTAAPLAVDFSATPTNAFDASKVTVTYVDADGDTQTAGDDEYSLVVTNTATGEVGGVELLSSKGTYTVVAVLDPAAFDYEIAGQNAHAMNVTVTKGTITSAEVAFAYKGKVVTSVSTDYLPDADVAKDITVTVKTANGLVPSTDYTVKYYKTVAGKDSEVSSITDAGSYKVVVTADGYTFSGTTGTDSDSIAVTVAPRDLSTVAIKATGTFDYKENGVAHSVYPYTGSEISATYSWTVDGKTYYELPAADYVASYVSSTTGKTVKLLDADTYKANLKASKTSVNYKNTGSASVEVSKKSVYSDVANTSWYAQYVYNAGELGYMTGYNGTNLFGPNDSLTRAQAAQVIFNMACENGYASEGSLNAYYNAYTGYETGFNDVDGKMWYAKAIAWADKNGIVTGYLDGSGNFGPEDLVTREQFALMLSRYAAKVGKYSSDGAADALATMGDSSEVCGWSADACGWAVKSELMGANGVVKPHDDITRAEVAKMVTLLQPEHADTIL